MQAIQISFDEHGHIFIPADMQESLQLKPGMTLLVEKAEQGGLQLLILQSSNILVNKDGVLVAQVTAIGNLDDVVRNERDRRIFDLLQRAGL